MPWKCGKDREKVAGLIPLYPTVCPSPYPPPNPKLVVFFCFREQARQDRRPAKVHRRTAPVPRTGDGRVEGVPEGRQNETVHVLHFSRFFLFLRGYETNSCKNT